jgi:hypothetical protein
MERIRELQKKKEQFTLKYGTREEKKEISNFFSKL